LTELQYDYGMRKFTVIFAMILAACSGKPGPKDVVFNFIEAVMVSDSLGVVNNLDVDAYLKSRMTEMSPEDSAKALAENREKTIQSLLGEGPIRLRWMDQQIVVNESIQTDSTAEVEVSFIDRTTRHQLYTKMQLRKVPDASWKIVYFR